MKGISKWTMLSASRVERKESVDASAKSSYGVIARSVKSSYMWKKRRKGLCLAVEHYKQRVLINLGGAFEISIEDLAETIARLTRSEGEIVWDMTKPTG